MSKETKTRPPNEPRVTGFPIFEGNRRFLPGKIIKDGRTSTEEYRNLLELKTSFFGRVISRLRKLCFKLPRRSIPVNNFISSRRFCGDFGKFGIVGGGDSRLLGYI